MEYFPTSTINFDPQSRYIDIPYIRRRWGMIKFQVTRVESLGMFFLRKDFAAVMPPSKKNSWKVFSMAVGSLPMAQNDCYETRMTVFWLKSFGFVLTPEIKRQACLCL